MYLYVVKEARLARSNKRPSMLKIGIAKNPDQRLRGLQTSNPNDLQILHLVKCRCELHAREMEKKIHKKLNGFWIRGEWFRGDALGRFVKIMSGYRNHGAAVIENTNGICFWRLL